MEQFLKSLFETVISVVFGGLMFWLAWSPMVHLLFPGWVANGSIAANLPYWDAVCVFVVFSWLAAHFHTKEKNSES